MVGLGLKPGSLAPKSMLGATLKVCLPHACVKRAREIEFGVLSAEYSAQHTVSAQ